MFNITRVILLLLGNLISDKGEESCIHSVAQLSENESSRNDLPVLTEAYSTEQIFSTSNSSSPPINIKINSIITSDDSGCIPSPFTSPILLEQIIENEQSAVNNSTTTDNSNELFYDFKPENFHAEQVNIFVTVDLRQM